MSKACLVFGASAIGVSLGLLLLEELIDRRQRRRQPKIRRRWELLGINSTPLPDLDSRDSMQSFTVTVVNAAEELINTGQVDAGIRHLALAVGLVRDTRKILSMVRPSLPQAYYNRLILSIMDISPGCSLPEEEE